MRKMFAVLAISAWSVVLAQSPAIKLTANIPFAFTIADTTLPAGEYSIYLGQNMIKVDSVLSKRSVSSVGFGAYAARGTDPAAATKLVFKRYGGEYFLSQALDAYDQKGIELQMSRSERELSQSASNAKPQTTIVMASLR